MKFWKKKPHVEYEDLGPTPSTVSWDGEAFVITFPRRDLRPWRYRFVADNTAIIVWLPDGTTKLYPATEEPKEFLRRND